MLATFLLIACHDNDLDLRFDDETPEIVDSVRQRTLTCNVGIAAGSSLNITGIDVIGSLYSRILGQLYSVVVKGQNVFVSVLLTVHFLFTFAA